SDLLVKASSFGVSADLVVAAAAVDPGPLEVLCKQFFLVHVLPLILILVNPELWHYLAYCLRHEAGKECIARVLGGGWQDAHVELLINGSHYLPQVSSNCLPLVEAHVVDNYEEERRSLAYHREDPL